MKLYSFKKEDSVYDIFQTLEKIPNKHKDIIFYIDEKHDFYKNKWWIKLILEKANGLGKKLKFKINNATQEYIIRDFGGEWVWDKKPISKRMWEYLYWFFLKNNKENFTAKRYAHIIRYMIIFLEIVALIVGLVWTYDFIKPKTTIHIQSNIALKKLTYNFYVYPIEKKSSIHVSRHINFPYYTETFKKEYELEIGVKDIKYIPEPASWIIYITNNTLEDISLKAHSSFSTENGIIYKSQTWVFIPGKTIDWVGEAKVEVIAETRDKEDKIIWSRWNLSKWTRLYIDKMYKSYWDKEIYAEVITPLKWWKTNTEWKVTQEDINILKDKLKKDFKEEIREYIYEYSKDKKDEFIPLVYSGFYDSANIDFIVYGKPGDDNPMIRWIVKWDISFSYIKNQDLIWGFKKYLMERLVSPSEFRWWDLTSLDIREMKQLIPNLYKLPVSINTLIWYDFDTDYNSIIPTIKDKVIWMDIEKAKEELLKYDFIAGVDIENSNNLNRVSALKSRIFIKIAE